MRPLKNVAVTSFRSRNFLAHRLLVTLGIMKDMGDDELFAELFNRQFPDASLTVEDIAAIRRPIGKLLSYDGDRYGLFHDRFKYFLVGEQPDQWNKHYKRRNNSQISYALVCDGIFERSN